MSDTVISVQDISKQYRLGEVGTGTLSHDLNRWWHKVRGNEDPYLKISEANDRTVKGGSDYVWALKEVSFEVKRGEVLGIIGRNGAGKSTLLKILSRVTTPTTGEIKVKGRIASLLEVGTGFNPELTGRDNIYLNGAILGMRQREITQKFDEIVDFSGVERYIDTPVKRYSSGMYVRLAFAVAAHLEPEIMIVDEVLAVGDAEFQKKCLGKMGQVAKGGRTVLFVSHNITAINSLCTSGLFLKNGQICTHGGIDVAISQYLLGTGSPNKTILKDRTDREGAGSVRMTQVWIEDAANNVVDYVASGSKIAIAVKYESNKAEQLKNVRVSLAVQNMHEQPLFLCSTELVSTAMHDCDPCGVVRCIIPNLPLSGGSYHLVAFFETNGIVQDCVNNAAILAVEDGDFYRSGKLYPPGWQGRGVLVDHRWEWPKA